jgi:hypothetical protein
MPEIAFFKDQVFCDVCKDVKTVKSYLSIQQIHEEG